MAEAIFLGTETSLEPGGLGRRWAVLLCVSLLLGVLPLARDLAHRTHLSLQLQGPRPSIAAILWGLEQSDPAQARSALRALERLPLPLYGRTLDQLRPEGPARDLLPAFLIRRGDCFSRRALAKLGHPVSP